MTGIVLQARLDSTRLPGKALLPLAGRPMLSHAMAALRLVEAGVYILATEPDSRNSLAPLAREAGFELFVGSKEDVLDRYCAAARKFKLDTIIRATGDNPLVSFELAGRIAREHLRLDADYSGFAGIAPGVGVEILKAAALHAAGAEAVDAYDREHVAPFLYRNPDRFLLHRPLAPRPYRWERRVTVDTPGDYEFIQDIFSDLFRGRPIAQKRLQAWIVERSKESPPHA